MPPLDIHSLRAEVRAGAQFRYRYFWGHQPSDDGRLTDSVFSQWWACRFEFEGVVYTSAEQFMMAEKARLFGDVEMLEAILATDDPSRCKALGRKVRKFDNQTWADARFDVVTRGNVLKFGQSNQLRHHLLGTDDDVLVEASPTDTIWGIGLGRDHERAADPNRWRGINLLGFALVRARAILRGELPPLS